MSTQIPYLRAKGASASRLRQRKYELVRAHGLPENLAGGSFVQTFRRCGKSNCRCATGSGHSMWSVTFSDAGRRRVERVPTAWVDDLAQAVAETQEYMSAIKEVMAINIELLAQARTALQNRKRSERTRAARKAGSKSA